MNYLKDILKNLEDSMSLFKVIGIFAGLFMGFKGFPENKLPKFLTHNFLMVYLYIILGVALMVLIICLIKPIFSQKNISVLWEYIININKTLDQNSIQILLISLLLTGIGVLEIYSSGVLLTELTLDNSMPLFKRHIFFAFLGIIILFFLFLYFHYSSLQKVSIALVTCSIAFLILGLIMFRLEMAGSKRWITIFNFTFNYFEVAKVASITYLAHILSRYKINFFTIIPIGFLFLLIFLLAEESSLGIITLLFLSTILMLIARFSSQIASSLLMGVQFIFLLILSIPLYRASQQLGGLLGIGFGESQYKLASQFEPISDFIFLVITEELGLIGAITIIFLFLTYTLTGIRVALKATDMFGRLLIFGATGVISLQALLNIGMSLKVIPVSEISLPFISYGSTPILVNMFFTGIILNVAKSETQRLN